MEQQGAIVKTFSRLANASEQAYAQTLIADCQRAADSGKNHVKEGFHAIEYISGACQRSALLVDPINGDPFVFQLPNLITTFTHDNKSSGSDHLRARISAELFFEHIVERIESDDALSARALGQTATATVRQKAA